MCFREYDHPPYLRRRVSNGLKAYNVAVNELGMYLRKKNTNDVWMDVECRVDE